MKEKVSVQIPISSINRDQLNTFTISADLSVLVFYDRDDIQVVEDLCPHMGGSLSKGRLCRKSNTIICPWHGYEFCTSELALKNNPNEAIWIKPLVGSEFEKYKTPKYKLKRVKFRIDEDYLYLGE